MWRTFASLFVAVAVAMLGIGIIAPILPLYADTFGASGVAIGFVFAAFSISRSLLGPWIGRFSDRVGRKRIMLVGLGAFSLISILYVLAENIWQLAAFRFLQGAASVMVTPIAQAYVGDITPVGREGRTINLLYAAMFFGVSLGLSQALNLSSHLLRNSQTRCIITSLVDAHTRGELLHALINAPVRKL